MSTSRILSMIAVLALGACVSPPPAEPAVHKTDTTTPPPADIFIGGRQVTVPVERAPEAVYDRHGTTAPAPAPTGPRPRPTGGSVREMVESYPVQR